MIPDYINCQNEEIIVCDYYMTSQCKETCAYARDIKGVGVGTMTKEDIGRLENEINNNEKGGLKK